MISRTVWIILGVAILLVIGVIAYFYVTSVSPTRVPEVINLNSDLICQKSGWIVNITGFNWRSDGYCESSIRGVSGVAVIHPLSNSTPRYLEQEVDLRSISGAATLNLSIANVAIDEDPTHSDPTKGCFDSIFRINVIDLSTGETTQVGERVVNYNEGWVHLSYDISSFSGKDVTVHVENYAGGPCGLWNGEWGAVDYVKVIA